MKVNKLWARELCRVLQSDSTEHSSLVEHLSSTICDHDTLQNHICQSVRQRIHDGMIYITNLGPFTLLKGSIYQIEISFLIV